MRSFPLRPPVDGPATHRRHPLDAVLAVGLLALLAPLLAATALILRLEGGPVLVRERRPGASGRPFAVSRFRPDAVGGLVRTAGLAGLPLLVNVVRGDLPLADALTEIGSR
jgi:lipopolysaccharide/colanic/teichoic acid biosynthesis glycosyltransferase